MKKYWKYLGIAALASVIPVRVKRDEETGKRTYQSLLFSVDVGHGANGQSTNISVNVEGVIGSAISGLLAAKNESELFADNDPEAATLDAEDLQVIADVAQEAADEAQEAADEAQAIADEAQEAADEAQAIADEAQAVADEAAEAEEALEAEAADDPGSVF